MRFSRFRVLQQTLTEICMSLIRSLCRALPAGCTAWLETSTNVQWRARVKIAPANHSHEYVHCGISQRQHSQWLRHPGSSDGWIINFNVTMFLKQRKTLSLTGAFAGLSGCQRRLGCAITFFWNDTCQMMGTTLHDSHSTLCSHQILVRDNPQPRCAPCWPAQAIRHKHRVRKAADARGTIRRCAWQDIELNGRAGHSAPPGHVHDHHAGQYLVPVWQGFSNGAEGPSVRAASRRGREQNK